MHKKTVFLQFAVILASISLIACLILVADLARNSTASILGQVWCNGISPCTEGPQPPVTVTAYIRMSQVSFAVHPEKREPAAGNWGTTADVRLQNCDTLQNFTFTGIVTDDTAGHGTIVIPSAVPVPDGDYRFFVRGKSHLNEEFNCYTLATNSPDIDLVPEGKELLAGEISNSYDNYINSLDLAVVANNLFTNNDKSDLNQDTEVNGLDLGTLIFNLFLSGD